MSVRVCSCFEDGLLLGNRATHIMEHRHILTQSYTLTAIDDVIERGRWADWVELRNALKAEPDLAQKIIKVCERRLDDRSAQRHFFWWNYAQHSTKQKSAFSAA